MSDRETILESLRAVHEFPGKYLFKAIGPNTETFVAQVVQSAINLAGPQAAPEVDTRVSGQGNHISVSVTVMIDSAESVLDVYALLRKIEGVTYVL